MSVFSVHVRRTHAPGREHGRSGGLRQRRHPRRTPVRPLGELTTIVPGPALEDHGDVGHGHLLHSVGQGVLGAGELDPLGSQDVLIPGRCPEGLL